MGAMKAAKGSSMKVMKAMKAMKAMKRISKIARGKTAKSRVLRGLKEKTSGGLTAASLMKNKRGKVVSKRASANGKKAFGHIKAWTNAYKTARKELRVTGFVAMNGKSPEGKALYAKTKALYLQAKSDTA